MGLCNEVGIVKKNKTKTTLINRTLNYVRTLLGLRTSEYKFWNSHSQTMVPRLATAAPPGNLLEMHDFRPHPRPTHQQLWAGAPHYVL